MGMDVRLSVCFFVVWSVGSVAQQTDAPSETPIGFPECVRVEEKCRSALRVCKNVQVSLTARHIKDNLLCIANDASTIYRLRGCPIGYYNQNTSGVCRTNENNGTDLLLTSDELEPGLHSFDCVIDNSDLSASTHVVVANDSVPFRVVQVLVNGVLQDRNNSTSFDLYVDDNLTVIVVAVGNVGNVSMTSANEERFNCEIGFPCNNQSSEVADRYLACSLGSPANMGDDGRVLTILLDNVELKTIYINMNERPLSPPANNDDSRTTTTTAATATVTATTTATITPTTTATTTINPTTSTLTKSSAITNIATSTTSTAAATTSASSSATTVASTSTDAEMPSPVTSTSIIPTYRVDPAATDHNATPTGTATDKAPHGKSFSVVVIAVITGLASGFIVLAVVLIVYCKCKKCRKTHASKKSVGAAPSPHKVLSYSCPHCDRLDEGIIKAGGYAIQKLPKNRSTDSYKEECKFSSEGNVPVIVCGHPECQAQSWLESSPMPENCNILQLHVAGDGDETPVQCNQRVKVISCPSPDDGPPVEEVLQWLNNVSRRGSITSLDGQGLELKEIRKGVTVLQKLVVERTSEIIEKQDQVNTTINALHIDAQYERQE